MDGITVVNTVQGICGYSNGITLGFIFDAFLASCMAIFAILAIYYIIEEKVFELLPLFAICTIVAIGLGAFAFVLYHAKPIYGPQQVVLVDDNVNFNEFMDRYVIVSQEGNLYTIYEK